jgi:hypothetical protein
MEMTTIIRLEARHSVKAEEMFRNNYVLLKLGDLELEITKDQGQEMILELERFCMEQNETYDALENMLKRTQKSLEQSQKREAELLNFIKDIPELTRTEILQESLELCKMFHVEFK